MSIFQLQNRQEIRHAIGRNLGIAIIGVATSHLTDTSSLIDSKNLLGGDDEHNQKEVLIYDAAGSIADGESSIVSDFTGATHIATCSPVFSSTILTGDKYEMWKTPWRIADINDAINQAIIDITSKALVSRVTVNNFTQENVYEYDWLVPYAFGNDFKLVTKVEYVYEIGTEKTIHTCDVVWDEYVLPTYVTASLDTAFYKEGAGSLKLVITDGYSATNKFATMDIDEIDLSGCTEVQIWIYSTVALAAGDLQLLLDDTALCASPAESLNIPATLANTWTRHIISLANPQSDSAIISVGIKDIVDKDAFNLWVDDIKAIDPFTNEYKELPIEYWGIARGATPYLRITEDGLDLISANTQVRLTGFSCPDIFSDDTTDSEVDPAFLIARTTGRLLISHAKSAYLDIHNRAELSRYWLGEADRMLSGLTPSMPGTARVV